MKECVFCKIANRKLPANIIYENELMLVFHDINPKADVHLLIIPKNHIESMFEIDDNDEHLIGQMMITANKIAKNLKIEGYKLVIHVGEKGGQEVFHLHLHLLANK